jgi:hypothetical protein
MSSLRAIAVVINSTACVLLARGSAKAQSCSINSNAPGPLSCSVTSSVRMTLRIPSLVGVTVTSADHAARAASSVVHAGVKVTTNRSYALQIASVPIEATDSTGSTARVHPPVVWSTAEGQALLSETPAQLDAFAEPTRDREPVQVAFARASQNGDQTLDPVRLILTIVAP